VLKSPANGVLVKTYTPTLKWGQSSLPSGTTFKRYELQVDDDKNFSSPVIDISTTDGDITERSYAVSSSLTPNVKYFWRVRAVNLVGADEHVSGWSKAWSFRTVILAPTLLSPADTDTVATRTPTFEWDYVDGAESYKIQISTDPNFGTTLISTKVNVLTFTPGTNLPKNKTLYWRVKALGPNGPSAWSDTFEFTTPSS